MYPTLYSIACNFRVLGFLCIKVDCLSTMHYGWVWFHPCFSIRIRNGVKLMTAEWRAPDFCSHGESYWATELKNKMSKLTLKAKACGRFLLVFIFCNLRDNFCCMQTITKRKVQAKSITQIYTTPHISVLPSCEFSVSKPLLRGSAWALTESCFTLISLFETKNPFHRFKQPLNCRLVLSCLHSNSQEQMKMESNMTLINIKPQTTTLWHNKPKIQPSHYFPSPLWDCTPSDLAPFPHRVHCSSSVSFVPVLLVWKQDSWR
jgi:hypothetical protein